MKLVCNDHKNELRNYCKWCKNAVCNYVYYEKMRNHRLVWSVQNAAYFNAKHATKCLDIVFFNFYFK